MNVITKSKRIVAHGGFTIVELLIVVVVVAILAAITVVAYNGISVQARESALKSDLGAAARQLNLHKVESGSFPGTTPRPSYLGANLQYAGVGSGFCLTASSAGKAFNITETGVIATGPCPGHNVESGGSTAQSQIADGTIMQTVSSANCTTTRARVVDARDNHTYWVQKMDDGRCWMLTNLAYGGGGVNTYGDARALQQTASISAGATSPEYLVPDSGVTYTSEPTNPSVSTNGAGQKGYLYNWCAAMGGQDNAACDRKSMTPAPDPLVSACPSGWRLPSSVSTGEGEVVELIKSSPGYPNSTSLTQKWLGQLTGYWSAGNGLTSSGVSGLYWSSSQHSNAIAYYLETVSSGSAYVGIGLFKYAGLSVRCTAL